MVNKVLFVGSNPSESSPDNSPFHPASRTRLTLEKWLDGQDVICGYINVYDFKTTKNRALSTREIKDCLVSLSAKLKVYNDYKIVAVGSSAKKAISLLNVRNFISIPHPSGRTRCYNDPAVKNNIINTLINFITGKI